MARLLSSRIGEIVKSTDSTPGFGCLWADGKTIGNASSGATSRAHADTKALFVKLWNSMANAQAPVSGGRGASAEADFDAGKTIALPDLRGRVLAGKDNMGGSSAGRLTSASGLIGTTLGNAGGNEVHTLTINEMPSHSHTAGVQGGFGSGAALTPVNGTGGYTGANQYQIQISNNGNDSYHNNTQPTYILNLTIVYR